ncbi:histidine kinase dimerization/phospho-acceptor domain-containing protein, partial [Lactobacillus crispatus]
EEQVRREFTANVSHELKTPLQSVMGSAELLENNLVEEDDR